MIPQSNKKHSIKRQSNSKWMVYTIVIACLVCRDVQQYPHGQQMKGVLILRVQGPLCFANVEHIKDTIAEHEVSICSNGAPLLKTWSLYPMTFTQQSNGRQLLLPWLHFVLLKAVVVQLCTRNI